MCQRKKLSLESDLDHQLIVKISWYVDMLVSQAHSLSHFLLLGCRHFQWEWTGYLFHPESLLENRHILIS